MKYCEDCKWFKCELFTMKEYGRCLSTNSSLPGRSLVSKKDLPFAQLERTLGNCGKEGRYYEQKSGGGKG